MDNGSTEGGDQYRSLESTVVGAVQNQTDDAAFHKE